MDPSVGRRVSGSRLEDPDDPNIFLEFGGYLCNPNADPSWAPLFAAASAVVVAVGAMGGPVGPWPFLESESGERG